MLMLREYGIVKELLVSVVVFLILIMSSAGCIEEDEDKKKGEKNNPPVAIIDKPENGESFHSHVKIDFDATSSFDSDRDPLEFTWGSNIDPIIGERARFATFLSPGEHEITLSVFDGKTFSYAEVYIYVIEKNSPPIAVFETDKTEVEMNEVVIFDASGAYDEDQDELEYMWDLDHNDGLDWANPDSKGMIATTRFDSIGIFTISLRVWDGEDEDIASMVITVKEMSKNKAPSARISADRTTVEINEPITFDGDDSSDPDGNELTYSWDFDESDGIGEDASGQTVTFSYHTPGQYSVTLTVSDDEFDDNDTLRVAVQGANNKPDAAAKADRTFVLVNEIVNFDASSSSDPDKDEMTFIWDFDASDGIGEDANGVYASYVYTSPERYTVTLIVSDGKDRDEDSLLITVNETFDHGVSLTCDDDHHHISAGNRTVYNITVTNVGSVDDTYSLTVVYPSPRAPGLSAELDRDSISLSPDENSLVHLTVIAEEFVLPGDYIIMMNATSMGDLNYTAQLNTTTTVKPDNVTYNGINMVLTDASKVIAHDESATYEIIVFNLGNVRDSFFFSIEPEVKIPETAQAQLSTYRVILPAFGSTSIYLNVTPGINPAPEEAVFAVIGVSEKNTNMTDVVVTTTTILPGEPGRTEPEESPCSPTSGDLFHTHELPFSLCRDVFGCGEPIAEPVAKGELPRFPWKFIRKARDESFHMGEIFFS